MNGITVFKKYGKLIQIFVDIAKKLPRKVRFSILSINRGRSGKIGFFWRYVAVASLARSVGKNVAIFPDVYFEYIENLSIGDNVSIHQMCYIDAEGGVEIGNDVSIAHRSSILSSNHNYSDISKPIKYQNMVLNKTIIEDDVWIGCGCVILSGVKIEKGSVIGANSTVTKGVSQYSVVVGAPAHSVKNRMHSSEV